jgi:hypothetical protein
MNRDTIFSEDRIYRYTLWRSWGTLFNSSERFVNFLCLNPSTATETVDDPTIRRCIGYADAWGYKSLCVTNIFAFRATDPNVMKAHPEPIGKDNDHWLLEVANNADLVVAAWGNNGTHIQRDKSVRKLIKNLHCLRITKTNQPEHPLYLPKILRPIPYNNNIDELKDWLKN